MKIQVETKCKAKGIPLEEGMATHSSILAWWIPWTEEPARLHDGVAKSQTQLSYWTELNHNGVIIHLEPDILECEVKWALGSIPRNKASGGDGILVQFGLV